MINRYFDYPVTEADPDRTGPTAADQGDRGAGADADLVLLAGAADADWSLLFDYGERRWVEPGEKVIDRATVGRTMVIVLSGSFRVVAPIGRRGRESVVAVLGPGAVVGEVGFAVGGARSHSVVAQERAEIFEFPWESFERLAAAHPRLGLRFLTDVLRIVASRTRVAEGGRS